MTDDAAIEMFASGVTLVFFQHAKIQDISPLRLDLLAVQKLLHEQITAALPEVIEEWQNALEGGMSESFLNHLMKSQMNEIAAQALEKYLEVKA